MQNSHNTLCSQIAKLLRQSFHAHVQGSGLPSLLQSQLTAPRVLPVHKVAAYAQSKLAEQQIHLQQAPVYWDKQKQQVCRQIEFPVAHYPDCTYISCALHSSFRTQILHMYPNISYVPQAVK